MRNMQLVISQPLRLSQCLCRELYKHISDLFIAGVFEPTLPPLDADTKSVLCKQLFVAPPHLYGRMVSPAVPFTGKRVEDLKSLNALLPKSAIIKHSRGLMKLRVRQKGLHVQPYLQPCVAPTLLRVRLLYDTCLSSI